MRLIDADELRAWLIRAARFLKGDENHKVKTFLIGKIIDHIDKMQTVEVPEVWKGKSSLLEVQR